MERTRVEVKELNEMLAQGQPVTILDVRPAAERAEWAIPGSLHVDAYPALKSGQAGPLATIDLPQDRPVVTVCGAGKTSVLAADVLRKRGWEAWSLAGGMKAWSLAWNHAALTLPGSQGQVLQVRRVGKGCLSYLVGSAGEAMVIDPSLEPSVYLDLASAQGWTITHILETHIHADHLSRARLLAEQCGAALYLPAQNRASFPYQPVAEGDVLRAGVVSLTALHTSGHTLESTCYRIGDWALLTGDTLFLAGVGRPDLEATPAEALQRAHHLYRSLQRLLALPEGMLVLPGHTDTAPAFDGAPLVRTLAEVKAAVELLHLDEASFVERLLAHIPPAPPNHRRIVELNETGLWPEDDPVELEAGANRCAVA
ncbi:MAG TPA: MBL fold metallo-hydrolase [Caldilineaceae bacterium]|nr:MBL fold metallo-hydrolase [Caldilineaceae bacterium]